MTNKDPELLPCQVSDAMLDAGEAAFKSTETLSVRRLLEVAYPEMRKVELNNASTIPTDGDAEWLRENAHDLTYGGLPLNAGVRIDALKRLNRIANRLSTIPSAGELRTALGERLLLWASQFATSNTAMAYDLREAADVLFSIQTISGKGMREALEQARLRFVTMSATAIMDGRDDLSAKIDTWIAEIDATLVDHQHPQAASA